MNRSGRVSWPNLSRDLRPALAFHHSNVMLSLRAVGKRIALPGYRHGTPS
jgi:hypothetical protein